MTGCVHLNNLQSYLRKCVCVYLYCMCFGNNLKSLDLTWTVVRLR